MTAKLSIYRTLQHRLGNRLPVVQLTKATLTHLSHTLEDFVLKNHEPAVLFTGFQESSHWRTETERYTAMAESGVQICIFAGKPLPQDRNLGLIQIELDADDPMRQEWFLAIFAEQFNVILCGLDQVPSNQEPVESEALRKFDTIWSFDPPVVTAVVDILEELVAGYRPDVLQQLQNARLKFPPIPPNPQILTTFTTELLRVEERLNRKIQEQTRARQTQQALYQYTVMQGPLAVLALDDDGTVLLFDGLLKPQLHEVLPVDVGQSVLAATAPYPDLHQAFQKIVDGTPYSGTINLEDDLTLELHSTIPENQLPPRICIFLDVTERIRVEKLHGQWEKAQLILENERKQSQLRNQLMVTLAHELRTPLATIQTATDILRRHQATLTDDQRDRRFDSIELQIRKLRDILADIDAAMRSTDHELMTPHTEIHINSFFDDIIQDLRASQEREIHFKNNHPEATIRMDAQLLHYTLSNLLHNAVKYSEPTAPIQVALKRTDTHHVLTVHDSGIGIPESELPYIFEPFYRASNVGVTDGTGLGLSIIQNSIHNQGGTIQVESHPGKGTTVTVQIRIETP